MTTTQASYLGNQKKEISRIVKPNGIVITCSWNSGGIGKKYGFEIVEIEIDEKYGQENAGEYVRKSYKGGYCYLKPSCANKIIKGGINGIFKEG